MNQSDRDFQKTSEAYFEGLGERELRADRDKWPRRWFALAVVVCLVAGWMGRWDMVALANSRVMVLDRWTGDIAICFVHRCITEPAATSN